MKHNNKKTILIVDDTKINIDILIELLDDTYDVIVSLSAKRALEIVDETPVNIILLDILMPDVSGYDVCRILKTKDNTKNIPVIFITANTDEESIDLAYQVGGIDYITKPFKALELLARVKTQLNMQNLLLELEESSNELKLLASQDHMTKLYNRRYFADISVSILDLAKRNNKQFSILMIDIDKFKRINDTYGHHIGDEVIIALANVLKSTNRKSDIACRFGGEEFLILLPETDIDGAYIIGEKLRKLVAELTVKVEDQEIGFTISVGVSQIDLKSENDLEATIQRSDEGLYKAKESGRNIVCKIEK